MKLDNKTIKDIATCVSQYRQEFIDREIQFDEDKEEFNREINRSNEILKKLNSDSYNIKYNNYFK